MADRFGKHFLTGSPVQVTWEQSRIVRATPLSVLPANADATVYLCPGLVDIQINGFAGINFGDPELTVDQVRTVTHKLWETGVTHFLPTLITDSVARMEAALRRLRLAIETPELAPSIVGIHLEGPYLSAVDGPRGAHPLEHCKDPDWDEFQRLQEASGNTVRLVTLAPERSGAVEFIRKAAAAGVRIAIGHTAANRDQILAAVDAGATLSTHLGNAAHDMLQRHHNYLYDQLAEDRLYASLIVDGHHLPPHLVKIFSRVKGTNRTILTSDAVQYAALPPGVYDASYRKFEVRADGFIGVVGEPRLAGSGLLLIRGVENFVQFTGATLANALRCASEIPAKFLGLDQRIGQFAPAREASLLRIAWNEASKSIKVLETILAGQTVYGAES